MEAAMLTYGQHRKLLYWYNFTKRIWQNHICVQGWYDVGISAPGDISAVLNHSIPSPYNSQVISIHYPTKHGGQSNPVLELQMKWLGQTYESLPTMGLINRTCVSFAFYRKILVALGIKDTQHLVYT